MSQFDHLCLSKYTMYTLQVLHTKVQSIFSIKKDNRCGKKAFFSVEL